MKEFRSFLAPQIRHFIRYRQASQRWNDSSYEENLMLFDRYCLENYPGDTMLTQEMVDGWCRQRDRSANNSCRSRIYVVDSFVRFLNGRGLSPVQPPQIPRKEMRTYIPHAFTQEELSRFFHECDHIPIINNRKETLIRKMTIPVFFRLLYSSGIRTNEARLLPRENADLERGVLDIQYSKGHDQHYIVLHDSMLEIMRRYDTAIGKIVPGREYFFPSIRNSHLGRGWVTKNFNLLWRGVNASHATAYEFRHHYAVENINRWVGRGFEFHDRLVFLSKSMGHTTVESTKYYYSIVPGLSEIIKEQTQAGSEWMMPEVPADEEA